MKDIRIIHPSETEIDVASGAMTRIAGVSKNLTGAEGIHLAVATIPVGCGSDPHIHTNCESAIYVVDRFAFDAPKTARSRAAEPAGC